MIREKRHSISGVFVFWLLGVFAVFSLVLVLFAAQAYRNTVALSDAHDRQRIAEAFLRNVIRANDISGAVSVREFDGLTAVVLEDVEDDEGYAEFIYSDGETLRDLYTSIDLGFRPGEGEAICRTGIFEPVLEDGTLTVTMTGADGEPFTAVIAVRCGS